MISSIDNYSHLSLSTPLSCAKITIHITLANRERQIISRWPLHYHFCDCSTTNATTPINLTVLEISWLSLPMRINYCWPELRNQMLSRQKTSPKTTANRKIEEPLHDYCVLHLSSSHELCNHENCRFGKLLIFSINSHRHLNLPTPLSFPEITISITLATRERKIIPRRLPIL